MIDLFTFKCKFYFAMGWVICMVKAKRLSYTSKLHSSGVAKTSKRREEGSGGGGGTAGLSTVKPYRVDAVVTPLQSLCRGIRTQFDLDGMGYTPRIELDTSFQEIDIFSFVKKCSFFEVTCKLQCLSPQVCVTRSCRYGKFLSQHSLVTFGNAILPEASCVTC